MAWQRQTDGVHCCEASGTPGHLSCGLIICVWLLVPVPPVAMVVVLSPVLLGLLLIPGRQQPIEDRLKQ